MQISKYELNKLIRYVELKNLGRDVLAGLLRQSASFDMEKALQEFEKGNLEVFLCVKGGVRVNSGLR